MLIYSNVLLRKSVRKSQYQLNHCMCCAKHIIDCNDGWCVWYSRMPSQWLLLCSLEQTACWPEISCICASIQKQTQTLFVHMFTLRSCTFYFAFSLPEGIVKPTCMFTFLSSVLITSGSCIMKRAIKLTLRYCKLSNSAGLIYRSSVPMVVHHTPYLYREGQHFKKSPFRSPHLNLCVVFCHLRAK